MSLDSRVVILETVTQQVKEAILRIDKTLPHLMASQARVEESISGIRGELTVQREQLKEHSEQIMSNSREGSSLRGRLTVLISLLIGAGGAGGLLAKLLG